MTKHLNLHVLHTHSVNNLNRDDMGEQKSCIYGGHKRARISSQCQKYWARHSELIKALAKKYGFEISIRTDKFDELGVKVDASKKDLEEILGKGAVVAVGANELKNLLAKKGKLGSEQMPFDVALFGRMFAKKDFRDDAAASVAHAITVNSIGGGDYDWFAATDDFSSQGSAHINSHSFSTGTFYKQMSIDIKLLADNLKVSEKEAADIAVEYALLFSYVVIESNAANGDNNTLPDFIMIEASDRPVSYSNEFHEPCNLEAAVEKLSAAPEKTANALSGLAAILGESVQSSHATFSTNADFKAGFGDSAEFVEHVKTLF